MYADALRAYSPQNEQEDADRRMILEYIRRFPDNILTRDNAIAHMTSSGFVVNADASKVLMAHHNLYRVWAWTGGHADGDPDLLAVAEREAREETGIVELTPVSRQMLSLDILPVWGHWKRGRFVASHLHLSVAYGFVAAGDQPVRSLPEENSAAAWLPVQQLEEYVSEPQMLPIYRKIMNRV